MANTFFHFKQFTVHQDQCSMKVCTDSCLFGAWIAAKLESGALEPQHILDIGTGTGLLALMVAQKSHAKTDAVEIDKNAFFQAGQNFKESAWRDKLKTHLCDIREFAPSNKFDLAMVNPPFFKNDLASGDPKKNIAKHEGTLTLENIFATLPNLLTPAGCVAMLVPYHRTDDAILNGREKGFYLWERVIVKHSSAHAPFRSMLYFGRTDEPLKEATMNIREVDGTYSGVFRYLLQDYYLDKDET